MAPLRDVLPGPPVEVTPEATSTPLSPRVFFFLLPFRMLLRAGNQLYLRLIYTYLHHPRELHSVGGTVLVSGGQHGQEMHWESSLPTLLPQYIDAVSLP